MMDGCKDGFGGMVAQHLTESHPGGKFNNIIWGFPVELETDCQVLQDVLMSDNLSTTPACWCDGMLAHQITDVHHIPG